VPAAPVGDSTPPRSLNNAAGVMRQSMLINLWRRFVYARCRKRPFTRRGWPVRHRRTSRRWPAVSARPCRRGRSTPLRWAPAAPPSEAVAAAGVWRPVMSDHLVVAVGAGVRALIGDTKALVFCAGSVGVAVARVAPPQEEIPVGRVGGGRS